MLLETIRLALRSVKRNALRSFLTLLGIVIGVAAVIAMITIGSGTTEKVKADISKLGSNLLVVRSGAPSSHGASREAARPLGDKELAALSTQLSGAKAVSAASQMQVRAVFGTDSITTGVTGTDPAYFTARDWKTVEGRNFSDSETRTGAGVCIIGNTVRKQFFGGGNPLGMSFRVGKMTCKVIGVLETKGFSGFGTDQDNVVMMPLSGFQRRISGSRDIDTIYVSAAPGTTTSALQDQMETLLREVRRITPDKEDDFTVRDMTQIADAMASTTAVMTGMLGAVAGVSLLVGGIGIMNIMLVSVTERTREIGVRKALGATRSNILLQFLMEALVLCLAGGSLGVLLGIRVTDWLAKANGWNTLISPDSIFMAFGTSAAIGILFGLWPASRAARLDPIQALRYE